jgi:galactofuranose transport system ATP-binding protein
MSPPLLSMTGINKAFNGTAALVDASLHVGKGEVHALVGQNGAGKSTMIKILTGYYTKDAGEIIFDGESFNAKSPHDAQSHGISTIYQEINLVGARSVAENICLGRNFSKRGLLDWPAMRDEARQLLAKFNIKLNVDSPLSDFSTATQQMIAIARAIGFNAKLVIMDEPTSSLDARETVTLFAVVRQLKNEGVSVIFVSHKLDELYEICDRVTIMRDGRTVKAINMSEISKLQLVSSMLGRDISRSDGRQTGFGEGRSKGEGTLLLDAQALSDGKTVKDVSLKVRQGEIAGVSGLLGSGRSETAHLLFGSTAAVSGNMTLDGKPYQPRQPQDAISRGVGFLTEDRKLEGIIPDMSITDNILLAVMSQRTRSVTPDPSQYQQLVADFIRKLGIKCAGPDQKVRELSGGNQ